MKTTRYADFNDELNKIIIAISYRVHGEELPDPDFDNKELNAKGITWKALCMTQIFDLCPRLCTKTLVGEEVKEFVQDYRAPSEAMEEFIAIGGVERFLEIPHCLDVLTALEAEETAS